MFTKNSRYYGLETIMGRDRSGRKVRAVKLRRLPVITATATSVKDGDQLDVISERRYQDATQFWHIGDANSELEVNELVRKAGRTIQIPED